MTSREANNSDAIIAVTLRGTFGQRCQHEERELGKTYRVGFTGKNPERGAEEGEEAKPKFRPPNGFDC